MSNKELTEFLAIRVMGWTKGETFWEPSGYLTCVEAIVDEPNCEPFDPLNDHNHMALVDDAMMKKGWEFRIERHNVPAGVITTVEVLKDVRDPCYKGPRVWLQGMNNLRIRAEAIAEAISK